MRVAAVVGFSRARSVAAATHVLARATGPGGKSAGGVAEIAKLDVRAFPGGGAPVPGFDVARTRYAWDVWGGESGSGGDNDNENGDARPPSSSSAPSSAPSSSSSSSQCRFARLRYPDSARFAAYAAGKLSEGLSAAQAASALEAYGPNACPVPVPAFSALLREQLVAPFFVFQVFCVGLWTLDEYWVYSAFTLLMLVGFESTVVGQRLRNLTELRGLQAPKARVRVFRGGKWTVLPGEALVPGDLVSIGGAGGRAGEGGNKSNGSGDSGEEGAEVPADCLLLAGRAVVEEAALTGESAPQWKAPVYESAAAVAARARGRGGGERRCRRRGGGGRDGGGRGRGRRATPRRCRRRRRRRPHPRRGLQRRPQASPRPRAPQAPRPLLRHQDPTARRRRGCEKRHT